MTLAAPPMEALRPSRPGRPAVVTRPPIEHHASHTDLLLDADQLGRRGSGVGGGRTGRLDAVIVPTIRPAKALRRVIRVTAAVETLLVVLCSRDAVLDEVADEVARVPGARALVIDVPADHGAALYEPATSRPYFRSLSATRNSDLSLKRNLGLALARLRQWSKILFLDDDVRVGPLDVARMAFALENAPMAAFRSVSYPDNSVACHANRESGGRQGVFVSGAALGVYATDLPLRFFPDVYNEDWFSFAHLAARRQLARVGDLTQQKYDPFADPGRAEGEEFGDTLAEGLYALMSQRWPLVRAETSGYWTEFLAVRRAFLETIAGRLASRDTVEDFRMADSIAAATAQSDRLEPEHCADFVRAWQQDQADWADAVQKLRVTRHLAEAMDLLELPRWRRAEFAMRR